MNKKYLLLLILFPTLLFAEDFDKYLKKFFADSSFQKTHVSYPIPGHFTYLCDSLPKGTCSKDTLFAKNENEWDYMGYGYGKPGVIYKRSNKCPEKLSSEKDCIYIEIEEPETCFNLQLYFKKVDDNWKLIYMWYFTT